MPDEESFCHKYGQIRSSIIPTESVRMLKLNLGPNENGLVVNYETTPEEISQKVNKTPLLQDAQVVPITMRKYLLYMQNRVE